MSTDCVDTVVPDCWEDAVPSDWEVAVDAEAEAAAEAKPAKRPRRAAPVRKQCPKCGRSHQHQCPNCSEYGIRGYSKKTCHFCGYNPPPCKGEMSCGFYKIRYTACGRFATTRDGWCNSHAAVKGRAIATDQNYDLELL